MIFQNQFFNFFSSLMYPMFDISKFDFSKLIISKLIISKSNLSKIRYFQKRGNQK